MFPTNRMTTFAFVLVALALGFLTIQLTSGPHNSDTRQVTSVDPYNLHSSIDPSLLSETDIDSRF